MICWGAVSCRQCSVRVRALLWDEGRTLQISETVNAIVRLVREYVVEENG